MRAGIEAGGDAARTSAGLFVGALILTIALAPPICAIPSTLDVNLDGTMGAESTVSLELRSSAPIRVRCKLVNKAVGQAFTFNWFSSGPGGFSSSLAPGTCTGLGTQWDWETVSVIYSFSGTTCTGDICLSRTSPAPAITRGPFTVPGRSLTPSGVTLSAGSLTSSLLTFFSPATELTRATGAVQRLTSGGFRYRTRVLNLTSSPVVYDLASQPPCACPGMPPCPECEFTGVVLPPGGAKEYCLVSPFPAKEEPNGFTVCGAEIPDGPLADAGAMTPAVTCSTGESATRGSFNVLVPDTSKVIGLAPFLTPLSVSVTDPNSNGVADPGEAVSIRVFLVDVGSEALTGVSATLTSPPIDLTLDGTANSVAVNITTATSAYPSIAGSPPTSPPPGDCATLAAALNPQANTTSFVVVFPANHPRNVGRPFNLNVTGSSPSHPSGSFQMNVPFVLAVGSTCDAP